MSPAEDKPGMIARIAVEALITGRVQGVFFRGWTEEQARHRGLTGWVPQQPRRHGLGAVHRFACGCPRTC